MSEPPSAQELEAAMRAVADDRESPGAQETLFALLREAEFVVATPLDLEAPGEHEIPAGETLQFITIEHEGETVLPAFTSTDRLSEWITEDAGYALLPAAVLLELTSTTGIERVALNPGADVGGVLERAELEALARGEGPSADADADEADGEDELRVGRPSELPPEPVLAAVAAALEAEPQASGGWLFLAQRGSDPPELMVGVALADGLEGNAAELVMRSVVEAAFASDPGVTELRFLAASPEMLEVLRAGAGVPLAGG